ncbi:hypothetical protein [Aeromicrobium fastidiosum]|uniref:hypothetical protein n=1 Tax=Aeromicrobium fastidiosum TaxID=52699 RepID=UPI00165F6661|nr:hypothetical protein [Aeromicrobium fastidiosum]MBP2391193.1 hypothetical protein [Aeromicrobium fastidiosum]
MAWLKRWHPRNISNTTLVIVIVLIMVVVAAVLFALSPDASDSCDQVGRLACIDGD